MCAKSIFGEILRRDSRIPFFVFDLKHNFTNQSKNRCIGHLSFMGRNACKVLPLHELPEPRK